MSPDRRLPPKEAGPSLLFGSLWSQEHNAYIHYAYYWELRAHTMRKIDFDGLAPVLFDAVATALTKDKFVLVPAETKGPSESAPEFITHEQLISGVKALGVSPVLARNLADRLPVRKPIAMESGIFGQRGFVVCMTNFDEGQKHGNFRMFVVPAESKSAP